jgi:hypothetical protein
MPRSGGVVQSLLIKSPVPKVSGFMDSIKIPDFPLFPQQGF